MERVTVHAAVLTDIYKIDGHTSEFYAICVDSKRKMHIYMENKMIKKFAPRINIGSTLIIDGKATSGIGINVIHANSIINI